MAVAAELRASGAEVSFLGARERIEAELAPGRRLRDRPPQGARDRPAQPAARGAVAVGRGARARSAARGGDAPARGRRRARRRRLRRRPRGAGRGPRAARRSSSPRPTATSASPTGCWRDARRRVCLAFPIAGREGERYLVTGRPVPAAVLRGRPRAARERFGVAAEARCLLVMGGSQGARSVNLAAIEAFAERGRAATSTSSTSPGRRDLRGAAARLASAPHAASATRCSPTSPTSATSSPPATWSWLARAARSSR